MPSNWKRFLVFAFIWAILFACVTIWLLFRGGYAWSPASVTALMCLNFIVLIVRIVAKRMALGTQ